MPCLVGHGTDHARMEGPLGARACTKTGSLRILRTHQRQIRQDRDWSLSVLMVPHESGEFDMAELSE